MGVFPTVSGFAVFMGFETLEFIVEIGFEIFGDEGEVLAAVPVVAGFAAFVAGVEAVVAGVPTGFEEFVAGAEVVEEEALVEADKKVADARLTWPSL